MLMNSFGYFQDQATRDQLSQQIREQITAARREAQAAARDARTAGTTPPPTPGVAPLPGEQVTVQQIPWNPNDDIPPRAMGLGIALIVAIAAVLILMPFTRALARAIDRSKPRSAVPSDVSAQLTQLTQAVDAIALEVERISEGQRFTTKLLADQRADQSRTLLAQPAADPSQLR